MKFSFKFFMVFVGVFLVGKQEMKAQLTGWNYASVIEISELQGADFNDYQVPVEINTAALIAAGQMKVDGSDMRFATDCEGVNLIDYFIESGINTTSTKVWLRVPELRAYTVTKIYFFTGNVAASAASDQSGTFPGFTTINLATTIASNTYDYLLIDAAGVASLLNFPSPQVITITANKIRIVGSINGLGRGEDSGATGSGTTSLANGIGAGGAGYGGNGGDGGGAPGSGGNAFNPVPNGIELGSGGGDGINLPGGLGGGALILNALDIEISGSINLNGENGQTDNVESQGTGGGSGGGLLINGRTVNITGSISAEGGDGGGNGADAGFGGGGGGSGGRVKIFYNNEANISGSISVTGGNGGPSGGANAGANGGIGVVTSQKVNEVLDITVNPLIQRHSPVVNGPVTACITTTQTYTANVIPGNTYLWTVTGGTVSSGQNTSQISVDWTTAGSNVVTLVTTNLFLGCSDTVDYAVAVSNVLPTPAFTIGASCEGVFTQFTNTSTIASGSIVTYNWSFGDGNISTTQDPSHTYLTSGNYTVTLEASSDLGCTASITDVVAVDDFPDASFIANTVCRGQDTDLDATPGAASYAWDLGDGSTATGLNVQHVYPSAGNFTVKLDVTSAAGCVSSSQQIVTVTPAPVPNFEFASACPGDDVTFTNTSSISSGTITSYAWDFGDLAGTSNVTNPDYAFAAAGSYTVQLVAVSDLGCADSTTKNVTVFYEPIVSFVVDSVCDGEAVNFVNNSTITSGVIFYTWDFGDGSPVSGISNPSHVYTASGIYTVTLTLTSDKGCTASGSETVVVNPNATALFTASDACLGQDITFTNTSSGPITTQSWNFGDTNTSNAVSPDHSYSAAGAYTVTLTVSTADGCSSQYQQVVNAFPQPVATFSAPNVCRGRSTQFVNTSGISSGNLSYAWDFDDGGSSTLQSPLHVYAATGNYDVTLIVTSDNNCADTVTNVVRVLIQPIANFTILPVCAGGVTSILDNSTGYDVGALYQVDIFNNGIYDAGPFPPGNSSITVVGTGEFEARIRITNANGCRDSVVRALNLNETPIAGFTVADECFGVEAQFTNTTTGATPALPGSLSYQWDFGDGGSSTDINPKHEYDSSGIFTITLVALSSEGCSDTFSNTMIVYPLPVAEFSTPVACFDRDVTFSNLSTIPFGTLTHEWLFGDGASSDSVSPTHRYTNIGTYQVQLDVTSDAGCVAQIIKNITVYPNPAANFLATSVCQNEENEFTNFSSIAAGTLTYQWTFGDGFNSVREEPTHRYANAGNFNATLTATSAFGCTDSISRIIQVFPKPVVDFTPTSACRGDSVFFTNNSTISSGSIVMYNWKFGDGGASLDFNPSHIFNISGTYAVVLRATSDKGCVDSTARAVIVHAIPSVSIIGSPLQFCPGNSVDLVAQATPITRTYTYQWTPGNQVTQSITVNSTGTFSVIATDQFGCSATDSRTVSVFPLAAANVSANPTEIDKGFQSQLQSTGGVGYEWSADPFDPSLNTGAQNPVVLPLETTTYTVTVTDANGCTATASVTVNVTDNYFVDPYNVITPNNDGFNDRWEIENILTYPDNEVLIFDRWGTLVYQKRNYDNTWDGTYDGNDLPQGTYFYVIKFDNSDRLYKGSVSILR